MARKFFNQKVKVNDSKKTLTQIIIISVCVVGVIICFIIAGYFNNRNKKLENATIKIRESVSIEINGDLPDKTLFFTELENVKEEDIKLDYDKADISKVGEYEVEIKVYNKKYTSKLLVIDSVSPELTLKDVTIEANTEYSANDFVEACSDNSKEDCKIQFYTLATDQDGKAIDYSKYSNVGTYKVQIQASDSSENITLKEAILTIGKGGNNPKPVVCKYGNDEYDTNSYVLAVKVSENGCALDKDLYQDDKALAPVRALMENETIKLKKEFSKLNVSGDIVLNRNASAIPNKSGSGIVGYSLYMELTLSSNGKDEVVESYYVDQTGKRTYSVNKYNLK